MNVPAASPDVSILVVAYNSQAIIADCLGSVPAACTRHTYEILLVDNSDGASAKVAADRFPDVGIVPSRGNIGFAGGNNLLAAHAKGRYLLLLNPDVVLKPEAIDRLMDAAHTYPEAAAWGGVTLDQDDRPDLGNTVHVPSLREMASRTLGRSIAARVGHIGIDKDAQVDVLSGSFVMFARKAWDEVGGLDDRYFLYCEEVDLFYRLAQRGYRFWRISSARANHDVGHGEAASPMRELYLSAGVMQFAKLHWSWPAQISAFLLIWILALQRFLASQILGSRSAGIKKAGDKQRYVALRPNHWRNGYDPKRGLLTKLRRA